MWSFSAWVAANVRQRWFEAGVNEHLRNGMLVLLVGIGLGSAAHAQSTWLSNPGSSDWNMATNWVPATVPTNGTAIFDVSTTTTITFSALHTSVGVFQFNALAPAYSFNFSSKTLTFNGTGIFDQSSHAPSFSIANGTLTFASAGADTAGDATIVNTEGLTLFGGIATAGTALITNNSGTILFQGASTAGDSTITTNSTGVTFFSDTSTGGQARFITNSGGIFDISELSSGGMAVGSIEGAGTYQLGSKALTVGLNNRSTEVTGAITDGAIDHGPGGGGLIKVGTGTLTLSGTNTYIGGTTINGGTLQIGTPIATGSIVGSVVVNSNSTFNIFNANTAGITTITLNGGTTNFLNASTAGNSTITTNSGGQTKFFDTSTGGEARFITTAGGSLSIFSLTSDGMTAGSIEGAGDYLLGRKTLTVGSNNRSTEVSGNIIEGGPLGTGGSLIKVGTGTLTLSGANTYTGGTTVSGGILSVASDSNLGGVIGGITLQGGELLTTADGFASTRLVTLNPSGRANILAAAVGTTATYSDVLSGDGGLRIGEGSNTGTVVLAGNNTYSGGTTINSGTLQAGSTTAFSPNSAFTVKSVLDLNGFSNSVGSLAGSGTVTNNGSPAVLTAGGNGTNTVFSGTLINGTASLGLIKTGVGTLTLSGANTYSGGTVIDRGTLLVNNAQALGTGNVTVNGGILGADPQPINVKGNYTQNAGGTLQLNVAGGNPGQYDTLNVGGNAALGGTLKLISLGFQPKAGDILTLVATGGSVSGRFAQFIDPFATGPGFTFAGLVYEPDAVLLEFRSAASFALTPNQLAAARLLDAVHQDPRAANLISFLSAQPFANLPNAFQKISPDGLTAFYEISFSNSNIQRLNLEGQLDDLHNGSNGFSSNMKVNGATVNLQDRADANGISSKAVVEPVFQHAPENRWGVWVTGFGDFVDVDGDGNSQGYNFTTGGVTIGVDYRITDQLAIGVMGDYSHTWTSLQNGGNIDVNSGRGGVYATWYNHGIYLDTAIYAGHNSYNSSRSGLDGLADGNTGGTEWSTFLSGGYDFHFGRLTVGPIAALQYTYANVNGFSENGSLAPMQIQSDSEDSLRSDVGFRLFYQWQIGKILLEPSLKAAWEHEYLYSALPITAGFARIPGPSATFLGPSEGHDSAIVSAGLSAQWTPALSVYVNYDGQLGRGNYNSNAVTGGVRISF
jgi:outer membrane autotransporter protein